MLTGDPELDGVHKDLLCTINLMADAEQRSATDEVLAQLKVFRRQLAEHFRHEEAHLASIELPWADEHGLHHDKALATLDETIGDLERQNLPAGEIASNCFGILLPIVLTVDMEVVNWMAEHH